MLLFFVAFLMFNFIFHPKLCHNLYSDPLFEKNTIMLSAGNLSFLLFCLPQGSDDDDDGMKAPLPPDNPMPPPLPPTPDQVIIRKDYDPKGKAGILE